MLCLSYACTEAEKPQGEGANLEQNAQMERYAFPLEALGTELQLTGWLSCYTPQHHPITGEAVYCATPGLFVYPVGL